MAISIRNIGSKAVQKRNEEIATVSIGVLKELSEQAFVKSYSNALFSLAKAVQEIGKGSAGFEMKIPAQKAIETLEMIGLKAVETKMEVVTLWSTLALEEITYESNEKELEALRDAAKAAREAVIEAAEEKKFVTREQIEIYPKLICEAIKNFGAYQDLSPSGYDATPNEEFTEEEFLEEEAVEETEEEGPEKEEKK